MQVPREGRLAGVDFGTVRIGIAITDPEQIVASPYENYNRRTEAVSYTHLRAHRDRTRSRMPSSA